MKLRVRTAAAAVLFALATSAGAVAPNLVVDGSFENGLTGWTQVGAPTVQSPPGQTPVTNPVTVIPYNSTAAYPNSAYGESVPPDNAVNPYGTIDPDPVGGYAAYFVDDNAKNQGLTQMVQLAAGNYTIGFDAYIPFNGKSNPYDATFSAQIANVTLASFAASTQAAGVWTNYSATATVKSAGIYNISFLFNTPGLGAAKDVVIDRVYIVAGGVGGKVLPEPGTLSLLGIAFAGIAAARYRRKGADAGVPRGLTA